MLRSASDMISDLKRRIARLERQASSNSNPRGNRVASEVDHFALVSAMKEIESLLEDAGIVSYDQQADEFYVFDVEPVELVSQLKSATDTWRYKFKVISATPKAVSLTMNNMPLILTKSGADTHILINL